MGGDNLRFGSLLGCLSEKSSGMVRIWPASGLISVLALSSALAGLPDLVASAAPAPSVAVACGAGVPGDVDGNGVGDLVIEAARYSPMASQFDVIRYPDGQRTSIDVAQMDTSREYSPVLEAAAVGDLDGDGCAEIVFGGDVPDPNHAPLNSYRYQPRLYIVPGSPEGPRVAKAIRIDLPGGGVRKVALLPAERQIAVTTATEGNSSLVIHTLTAGLTAGTSVELTATSLGIRTAAQRQDFGWALAAAGHTIVVGSPAEKSGVNFDAGAVYIFSTPSMKKIRLTQKIKGMPKASPYGQRFGSSVAYLDGRLVIGASHADIGNRHDNGRVNLIRWSEASRTYKVVRSFNQTTKGVPGKAENLDLFGDAVLITRGLTGVASYDVVVAARLDKIGKSRFAGSVTLTNFDTGGYRLITQNSPGVPGSVGIDHQFGTFIGRRHLDATSDALLAVAFEKDPDCPEAHQLFQTSGGSIRTSTWSIISAKNPTIGCSSRWGYQIAG